MDSIPDEQRGWTVTCRGTPRKALRLRTDWPVPKGPLSEGEVLVNVQAAGLNPSGWKLMMLGPNFLVPRPHVPEYDFSGVILDENGSGFVAGDSVYGCIPNAVQRSTQQGSLSQYIQVPSSCLVKKPSNVTLLRLLGLPLLL